MIGLSNSCDPLSRLRVPVCSTLQTAIDQLEADVSAALAPAAATEEGEDDAGRWVATRQEALEQLKRFVAEDKCVDDLIQDA